MVHASHRPSSRRHRGGARRGAATVEMALLTPLLVFLGVIAVDFARIFYYSQTVANCARNGALWASDDYVRAESSYPTLQEAALADASNLNDPANLPTVAPLVTGTDSLGQDFVEVTVSYKFETVSRYVGVPNSVLLARTIRMAKAPPNPKK